MGLIPRRGWHQEQKFTQQIAMRTIANRPAISFDNIQLYQKFNQQIATTNSVPNQQDYSGVT
jgi:hypothetical protein